MITGIHKNNVGDWCAVVNGRTVSWERGPGAKARAIRAAGTNRVIDPKLLTKKPAVKVEAVAA